MEGGGQPETPDPAFFRPPGEFCGCCGCWMPPREMPPGQLAIARAHGVKTSGCCRRFPRPEDKDAGDWCGEFKVRSDT